MGIRKPQTNAKQPQALARGRPFTRSESIDSETDCIEFIGFGKHFGEMIAKKGAGTKKNYSKWVKYARFSDRVIAFSFI